MKSKKHNSLNVILGLVLSVVQILMAIGFGSLPEAAAQTTPAAKVALFAKTGSGDYYTLYPDGVVKEDAFIGGFKSAQLDPLEENIYFYDPSLKVIAKINLKDGKVYKVIGKPKSSTVLDYSVPVKYSDASLGKLIDFVFDKYGNIFILDSAGIGTVQSPRILKASVKDQTIKEIFKVNDSFGSGNTFTLNGLSYDHDRYLYLTGTLASSGPIVLKLDPLTSTADVYAGTTSVSSLGFTPKLTLNSSTKIQGLAFDNSSNCYLSSQEGDGASANYFTYKVLPKDDGFTQDSFIGDGTGSSQDIGDGGQAKSAFASLLGARCLCGDKNGDVLLADSVDNRIRKILKDSSLITTIVGGGSDTISFGQFKTPKSISLSGPNSLLVDNSNNLYIVENSRILLANNVVTHVDKPAQAVKLTNLTITKIAGNEVKNPQGSATVPDLTLDYTYSGDQTVEVKGDNIPDGTNVKLLTINSDGTSAANPQSAMLTSGVAIIPVKVDAGTTKVVKAETDPFIPAPGVYLPGTEPMIAPGQLPPEPQISTASRDSVNAAGNLIPQTLRFNFKHSPTGWARYDNWYESKTKANAAVDPDNVLSDASFLDIQSYANGKNSISFDTMLGAGKNLTFSVWMRTDSGNITLPFGIGASENTFNGYIFTNNSYLEYLDKITYNSVTVTPTWQKFTVTSNPSFINSSKTLYLGGFGGQELQKVYIWGARLEAAQ